MMATCFAVHRGQAMAASGIGAIGHTGRTGQCSAVANGNVRIRLNRRVRRTTPGLGQAAQLS